jgi:tight adherence protein B
VSALPAALAGAAVLAWLALPGAAALRVAAVAGVRPRRTPAVLRNPPRAPVLAVAAAAAALVVAGPVAAALGVAAGVTCGRVLAARRAARLRSSERSGATEACATLAAELCAGRSPAQALTAAQSVATGGCRLALAAGAAAAAAGADVPTALLAHVHARRSRAPSTAVPELIRALAACWAVCSGAGSGLAAAVDRLEEGLRGAEAQRRAVAAELAGPRATAAMLAVLPLAGLALAGGLGADPLHVLLHTPAGLFCLLAGVGLDALGLVWTARLIASAGGAR